MKLAKSIALVLAIVLSAVLSPVLAAPISCHPTTAVPISAGAGAHVVLDAAPGGAEYTYDWTVDAPTALKDVVINEDIISFNVPECGATGLWTLRLVMYPDGAGAVAACKDTCLYTVSCTGLCDCPSTPDACIATTTTYTYGCMGCPGAACPESLNYDWFVSATAPTAPTVGTIPDAATVASWGAMIGVDVRTLVASADRNSDGTGWDGFVLPTEADPVTTSHVSFVVRQDTGRVIKWCTDPVTLWWDPTATMDSVVS